MSPVLKRLVHFTGAALAVLAIIFVVRRLHTYTASLNFSQFHGIKWLILISLTLVYGAASILLSQAWWNLLAQFNARVSRQWSIKVYGTTQLTKYVPGNIFHLAGRQALGMAAGVRGWILAKSIFWELGLLVLAGGLFSFLVIPLLWPKLALWISLGMFFAVSAGVLAGLARIISSNVSAALLWQIIFLMLSGLVFVAVLSLVATTAVNLSLISLFCGAYIIAWLTGLMVPGAPAGIGVREWMLMFLLKGLVAEADLLIAVMLGRVVTITGDVWYFLFCYLLPNQLNTEQGYSENTIIRTSF